MIVILCDGLTPKPYEKAGAIEFSPELDLLGEPYLDRLAEQYRWIGAQEVIWAGSAADEPLRAVRSDAVSWQPFDLASLNNGAVKPGETLVIADIRLWPDDETARLLRRCDQFPSALTTLTLPNGQNSYSEVIEASDTSAVCTVTRRYQQTMTETMIGQRASCPMALVARGDARGAICRNLLWTVLSGDQESVAVLASIADHEGVNDPTWIETEADYLRVTRRLLSGGEAPDPSARPIGDRVWAMPGAVVDPNCSLIGPVLLGRGCHVGRGTRIVGPTVVGESVEIGEGCSVRESVLMKGAMLPGGSRTLRSVVRAGEEQARPFGWLGDESGLERWGAISRLRSYSVVVPGRRALNKHKHLLHRAAKRALDICGALVGLMLTLPMYPFIAVAIKLSSRGPVFYTHRRQTLGGKEFACLKFRTMISDAHEMQQDLPNEVDGPQFHMEADPRLTRGGRFLRKTNLDEVPQFWNVLLGHMSLVGPRPSPDKENQYCPAWREARLSVRPGLTGMWQVKRSSDRSAGDFHEWIRYDVQYLQEWSLWTDLKILWATVWQIAGRAKEVLKRSVPPFN